MEAHTPKRILVVDDDPDFLAQQRMHFEKAGYIVCVAEGPERARALIDEANPDLAVLDLMMGDMDAGIVLAHELKKSRPELPIILVTGVTRETGLTLDAEDSTARQWLRVDRVLAKPVRFEQLRGEVEALLAQANRATPPTSDEPAGR